MKNIKEKTLFITIIVTLLIVLIGATYAYFTQAGGTGTQTDVSVGTSKEDILTFEVGSDINIEVNQSTFASGKGNASSSTFGKAILKTANQENELKASYNLYLNIIRNGLSYTSSDNTPELLLKVKDSSGTELTSITELDYKEVTDGKNNVVKGFDITTKTGLITILNNQEIVAKPTKTDTWNVEVILVNLDSDQSDNAGKSVLAKLQMAKGDYEEEPDVTIYASNIPTTYGSVGSIDCSSSTATYNQVYNRIEISDINTNYESCTLNYTERENKTYLNNYVTSLVGTTQGTGEVVSENGYRYEGKNPNNYIWFNNELWRIIGVFDSNTHGQSGKNLVKIIRNDSIGTLAWHKSNTNDWTAASLKSLLNGAYYNAEDGTSTDYCYGYSATVKGNCDYRKIGIQDGYRGMIQNVTWYLGGYEDYFITAEAFYGYERGTTVYSDRPTSTTGYIGLMYPSDYGYSVLSSSCARTTNIDSYSSSSCAGQSWLYGNGIEWTLTPRSSPSDSVFRLSSYGYLTSGNAHTAYAARPVLYLDSSVYYVDGDGSMMDPIIIGM